jgi:hypothetical protein
MNKMNKIKNNLNNVNITLFIDRYCMVMTDHFSGFTWAHTCTDKAADNLVKWAYEIIMNGFGCPRIVLSDNGGDVTNTLTKSMYEFIWK